MVGNNGQVRRSSLGVVLKVKERENTFHQVTYSFPKMTVTITSRPPSCCVQAVACRGTVPTSRPTSQMMRSCERLLLQGRGSRQPTFYPACELCSPFHRATQGAVVTI